MRLSQIKTRAYIRAFTVIKFCFYGLIGANWYGRNGLTINIRIVSQKRTLRLYNIGKLNPLAWKSRVHYHTMIWSRAPTFCVYKPGVGLSHNDMGRNPLKAAPSETIHCHDLTAYVNNNLKKKRNLQNRGCTTSCHAQATSTSVWLTVREIYPSHTDTHTQTQHAL